MVIFDVFKGYSIKFNLVIRDPSNLIYLRFDNILYINRKDFVFVFFSKGPKTLRGDYLDRFVLRLIV
jgi:hypothetical protein